VGKTGDNTLPRIQYWNWKYKETKTPKKEEYRIQIEKSSCKFRPNHGAGTKKKVSAEGCRKKNLRVFKKAK